MELPLVRRWRVIAAALCLAVMSSTLGCAGNAPGSPTGTGAGQSTFTGPKRIVAAIRGVPPSIAGHETNRTSGNYPGLDAIVESLHAALVHADPAGHPHDLTGHHREA